jgi:hypothetical protein
MGGEAGGGSWKEFREALRLSLSIDDTGTGLEKRNIPRVEEQQSTFQGKARNLGQLSAYEGELSLHRGLR